jgi:hypothetical protein
MNIHVFAQSIINDPAYRQSVIARAQAGTLPPAVEEMLWELADGRVPISAPVQSRTLALVTQETV